MFDLGALHQELRSRQPEMVDELERYVNIESGSRDKPGVDEAGRAVAGAFEALGFSIERLPQPECGDHLIARRSGSGSGRLLCLIHLDTVWPRGTLTGNPFRIEGDRAYGPGVGDMKGGWVVLLSALRALTDRGWDGLGEIAVFMVGDEELGSVSARPLIEAEAKQADWTLVFEPVRENGAVVTERGMVGAVYFEVRGKTAHTGAGDRGASAIEEMAHKVIALQRLTDLPSGMIVTVGTIEGGSARQVVPDLARIAIDVRAPSTALADRVIAQIEAIATENHVPGTTTIMTGGITRPAFERSPGVARLYALTREAGAELGLDVPEAFTRAGSDGSFPAALGIPTLDGLGAEGFNICSRDEYILLDSLPRRAALLAGIITRLPESDPGR